MVTMGDPGYPESSPMDCNTFGVSGTNFQDPGAAGDYPANYNETIVFCPDLNIGTKATVTFGINAGFQFDVDGVEWEKKNGYALKNPDGIKRGFGDNCKDCNDKLFLSTPIKFTNWLFNLK